MGAIGKALAPVLLDLLKVVADVFKLFKKLPPAFKSIIAVIGLAIPALIALNVAAGPIGLVLGGIAAAALAVAAAVKAQNKEIKKTADTFSDLKTKYLNAASSAGELAT